MYQPALTTIQKPAQSFKMLIFRGNTMGNYNNNNKNN